MRIDGLEIQRLRKFPRIFGLRAEYYEFVEEPDGFVRKLKEAKVGADVFSFLQHVTESQPKFPYTWEYESISVLRISTYEHWWKNQINDKTRNMVRKAGKKGIEIRMAEFNDELVRGIKEIYDENPMRQGKPFAHYGKDFETIKKDHITFLDRSEFIGAYIGNELVGFIKLVHGQGVSNCMQIIAKISQWNKAPVNALLAKAVEICAQKNVPLLHYGLWSRRGLGDFKKHHAFERLDVVRYFVPLNLMGRTAMALKLHRNFADLAPEKLVNRIAEWRNKWNARRKAVPQPATSQ